MVIEFFTWISVRNSFPCSPSPAQYIWLQYHLPSSVFFVTNNIKIISFLNIIFIYNICDILSSSINTSSRIILEPAGLWRMTSGDQTESHGSRLWVTLPYLGGIFESGQYCCSQKMFESGQYCRSPKNHLKWGQQEKSESHLDLNASLTPRGSRRGRRRATGWSPRSSSWSSEVRSCKFHSSRTPKSCLSIKRCIINLIEIFHLLLFI